MRYPETSFTWDAEKERINIFKHGINFTEATEAFKDPNRKIFLDSKHNEKEDRYFCVGKVNDIVITVRFTYRNGIIRIFGAGYWRRGRLYYEEKK